MGFGRGLDRVSEPKKEPAPSELPLERAEVGDSPAVPPWRSELSERVENFRRRRARSLRDDEAQLNIKFASTSSQPQSPVRAKVIALTEPGAEAGLRTGPHDVLPTPSFSEVPLVGKPGRTLFSLRDPAPAGEIALDDRVRETGPIEIVFEHPGHSTFQTAPPEVVRGLPVASMGRRFLAGLADALVLLVSAALFGFIFWLTGGRIPLGPLGLGVCAFIVVLTILVYFAVFTALGASTPGLASLGLGVRSMDGTLPTTKASFWRAFGYLVSVAGLMLGFVWALVDSDGLTWHDRMSGTFITARDPEPQG